MPIVLLPALSMLGATDEAAWREGAGPISIEVAKQLASNSPSLYRLLVDPANGSPLDIEPDHYRVTKAMRTALQIREEYCQFPGCMAKACSSQIDHIRSFESGGTTTVDNLEVLCLHHHLIKHFKDDRTRGGRVRTDQGPERQRVSLRGWVPQTTDTGRVSWTSPTGQFYPGEACDTRLPQYPLWLQSLIRKSVALDSSGLPAVTREAFNAPQQEAGSIESDWEEADMVERSFAEGGVQSIDMPSIYILSEDEEAQLDVLAAEHGLAFPYLGLAEES